MASGILNVNKPAGPTSFAVVRAVRRLPGARKVGHGGTLDPAADGVLPILINSATRLADFVHQWPKTYLATVTFGAVSDTGDRQGTITGSGDARSLTREQIEAVLPSFTGRVEQVPPMYSALKQGGEALYRKARRGEIVDRQSRVVEIHAIEVVDFDAPARVARLEVHSGRGMYVRSLAQDLGVALGCGAYLSALTRLAVGPLRLQTSIALDTIVALGAAWTGVLLPMDLPVQDWPAISLEPTEVSMVRRGQTIKAPADGSGRYRMLDGEGQLVAWGEVVGSVLQPRAVFDS